MKLLSYLFCIMLSVSLNKRSGLTGAGALTADLVPTLYFEISPPTGPLWNKSISLRPQHHNQASHLTILPEMYYN